jgi:hypothetical protein
MVACAVALPALAEPPAGVALRERQAQLAPELAHSPFGRPLKLVSTEAGEQLQGSIDAVISQPYALAREHLQQPQVWCEILMLHINTKQCTASASTVAVNIGRKLDQPLRDSYRVNFTLQPLEASPDYLSVRLSAASGPFSTHDYRIQLQAIPLEGGQKTFLHLDYAYAYGLTAKLAMRGYLATVGSGKVGFTKEKPGASSPYIGGMRGVVERNTMRYYLAIDAYLSAYSLPAADQFEKRIREWYASTERYAPQLHEMDQNEYLDMKRKEMRRQQQG